MSNQVFSIGGNDYTIMSGQSQTVPVFNHINASIIIRNPDYSDGFIRKNNTLLLIKCNHGEILPTDQVKLVRYISSMNCINEEGGKSRYKYAGWIYPRMDNVCLVSNDEELILGAIISMSLHDTWTNPDTEEQFDYWEVKFSVDGTLYTPVELEQNAINSGIECMTFNRKCAFVIFRDGLNVSDHLKFTVKRGDFGDDNRTAVYSRWE